MLNKLKTKQRYSTEMAVRYDEEFACVELTPLMAYEVKYQTNHNSTETAVVTPIDTPEAFKAHNLLGFCPLDMEKPFWISREKLLSIQNPLKVWVIKGKQEDILFATPCYIECVTLAADAKETPATAYQGNFIPRRGY